MRHARWNMARKSGIKIEKSSVGMFQHAIFDYERQLFFDSLAEAFKRLVGSHKRNEATEIVDVLFFGRLTVQYLVPCMETYGVHVLF